MSKPNSKLEDFLIEMQYLIAISQKCTFESGGIIGKNELPQAQLHQDEPIISKKAFELPLTHDERNILSEIQKQQLSSIKNLKK